MSLTLLGTSLPRPSCQYNIPDQIGLICRCFIQSINWEKISHICKCARLLFASFRPNSTILTNCYWQYIWHNVNIWNIIIIRLPRRKQLECLVNSFVILFYWLHKNYQLCNDQGFVKGDFCLRNLYLYFWHGESTSTANQKSKDLNKVSLLLQDLDWMACICRLIRSYLGRWFMHEFFWQAWLELT